MTANCYRDELTDLEAGHRLASQNPDFREICQTTKSHLSPHRLLLALALLLAFAGLWLGLVLAPPSRQQGDLYRIILVHVPASWMSMLLYLTMAACAAFSLWRHNRRAGLLARAIAPTGALMAMLSIVTGVLWGKPAWGSWWVWDARLLAMLVLFVLYIGFIALASALRAGRFGNLLLLAGLVNIPIIHFSADWWNSLHQGSSIAWGKPLLMSPFMLWGILCVFIGFTLYVAAVALLRLRCLLLEHDLHLATPQPLREYGLE